MFILWCLLVFLICWMNLILHNKNWAYSSCFLVILITQQSFEKLVSSLIGMSWTPVFQLRFDKVGQTRSLFNNLSSSCQVPKITSPLAPTGQVKGQKLCKDFIKGVIVFWCCTPFKQNWIVLSCVLSLHVNISSS